MVTVKMNGQKQLIDVRIEKEVFASKDQEMLQDLVRAAVVMKPADAWMKSWRRR